MKEKLKALIVSQIENQGFDLDKINSYSLNRKGNGVYQMIIFFGGKKTKKDDKRFPDLPIGKDWDTAHAVLEIIEERMTENEKVDILEGLKLVDGENKDSEGGW